MPTEPVNILCMKWGTLYGPEYVNRLFAGVNRHLNRPFRFVCFTDNPGGLDPQIESLPLPDLGLPLHQADTRWQKLALFRTDLGGGLTGTALFLDLDLVIVDDLGPFFDLPGDFRIIRDAELFRAKPLRRLNPRRHQFLSMVGNSSVFRFEIGAQAYVLEAYRADPQGATRHYKISQQFQSAQLAHHGQLDYWPSGWCVSFKNHCVPRGLRSYLEAPEVPLGARIVVFAGNLKMSDVMAGQGHRWHRRIQPVPWLHQAWGGCAS